MINNDALIRIHLLFITHLLFSVCMYIFHCNLFLSEYYIPHSVEQCARMDGGMQSIPNHSLFYTPFPTNTTSFRTGVSCLSLGWVRMHLAHQ